MSMIKLPDSIKKQQYQVRLRPYIKKVVEDKGINLSAYLEAKLLEDFGPEIDAAKPKVFEKYKRVIEGVKA